LNRIPTFRDFFVALVDVICLLDEFVSSRLEDFAVWARRKRSNEGDVVRLKCGLRRRGLRLGILEEF
jgi:hypothetical protein